MADDMRNYFDRLVPVEPGEGRLGGPVEARKDWAGGWGYFAQQYFVHLPKQLNIAHVKRKDFAKAVKF